MILPSYGGIIINRSKIPYSTTSIVESRRDFFVAHLDSGDLTSGVMKSLRISDLDGNGNPFIENRCMSPFLQKVAFP